MTWLRSTPYILGHPSVGRAMDESREQRLHQLLSVIRDGAMPARQRALQELIVLQEKPFLYYLRKCRLDTHDGLDVLQLLWLKIWDNIGAWRGEKAGAWMRPMLYTTFIDWQRRNPSRCMPTDEALADNADGRPAEPSGRVEPRHEEVLCVREVWRRFCREYPRCAEVLRLFELFGWKIREVAEQIGRSEPATKEFLSQCRKRLRPLLEDCR